MDLGNDNKLCRGHPSTGSIQFGHPSTTQFKLVSAEILSEVVLKKNSRKPFDKKTPPKIVFLGHSVKSDTPPLEPLVPQKCISCTRTQGLPTYTGTHLHTEIFSE